MATQHSFRTLLIRIENVERELEVTKIRLLDVEGERFPSSGTELSFTDEQQGILRLHSKGLSAKQIADALKIKTRRVEFSKYSMMKRLGLKSSVDLALYASRRVGG